jgi:hypothetical protein
MPGMGRQKPRPRMDAPDFAAEAELAFFEERAAVREYLGGMDRGSAEFAALEDTQRWVAEQLRAEPGWRARLKLGPL